MSKVRRSSRRQTVSLVTAAAAALLVALAIAAVNDDGSSATAEQRSSSAPESSQLEREFALLRRDTRPSDRLSSDAQNSYAQQGIETSRARKLELADGSEFIAVPGDENLCAGVRLSPDEPLVQSCIDAKQAVANGVWLTTRPAPSESPDGENVSVVGLVPDGADDVFVSTDAGSRAKVDPVQGVVVVRSVTRPQNVSFVDENGTTHRIPFGEGR